MPPPSLVDSHCHLDFPDFAGEVDAVVARAAAAGVTRMVTICTRLRQAPEVRAIAEAHDGVFWAAGTHPMHAAEEPLATVEELVALAAHPKFVGIGETGLDYHYTADSAAIQAESLRLHIEAARRTGLPLIIHARDADADIGRILAEEHAAGPFACVMHCFTSGARWPRPRSPSASTSRSPASRPSAAPTELRAIFAAAPRDRLLVETDSPYLAPLPHRGKRNEPAYTADTARRWPAHLGIDPAEFAALTARELRPAVRQGDPSRRDRPMAESSLGTRSCAGCAVPPGPRARAAADRPAGGRLRGPPGRAAARFAGGCRVRDGAVVGVKWRQIQHPDGRAGPAGSSYPGRRMSARLRATILGCGSSAGVPRIGGDWGDCDPANPRNRRSRCSLLVERITGGGRHPGARRHHARPARPAPRRRRSALLDGVAYTHPHADHLHGIDDLRTVVHNRRARLPVWADAETAELLLSRFAYVFVQPAGSLYPPILDLATIDGPFVVEGAGGAIPFQPFRVRHGRIEALGFRIGDFAYLPDVSDIPDEAWPALAGLDTWVARRAAPQAAPDPRPSRA